MTAVVAVVESLLQSGTTAILRITKAIGGMGTSEWIAFGSMVAASIAAWHAIRSTQLSRRMYSLSVAEQRRTESALEVYLADCRILHLPSEQRRIYLFDLLISNRSIADNSIKEIKLSLNYAHRDKPPSNVVVPHDSNSADTTRANSTELLRIPCPIAAGNSISGAAVFPISNALLGSNEVESYNLTVLDAHDQEASCQPILLMETES